MYASEGMRDALNYMRECSVKEGRLYHQYVPYITAETTISEFGAPILDAQNVVVMNDFIDLLKKVGCSIVQGYYFSKPVAPDEFEKLL